MNVLLYGGTFDPPHNGHLHNLAAAAGLVQPDGVVVMPAGVPPHKAASRTPAALRLAMCGCFAALQGTPGIPRLAISRWEIDRAAQGKKNYTVDTLAMLAQACPGAQLYLAVGSDMLLSFTTWHDWPQVLRQATLVAVSRQADDLPALQAQAEKLAESGGRVLFAAAPPLPMASSALRARLAAGESCAEALPPLVRQIIAENGLYRGAAAGQQQ